MIGLPPVAASIPKTSYGFAGAGLVVGAGVDELLIDGQLETSLVAAEMRIQATLCS